jgi:hypothetical protein
MRRYVGIPYSSFLTPIKITARSLKYMCLAIMASSLHSPIPRTVFQGIAEKLSPRETNKRQRGEKAMRKLLLAGIAAAGMVMSVPAVNATTIGTIPMGTTQNNQIITTLTLVEGWYGADLFLVGGPATIRATLIGAEASNTNSFVWGANTLTSGGGGVTGTLANPIGTFFDVLAASGLLPFSFTTNVNSALGNVANGSNIEPNSNNGNFFVTLTNSTDFNSIDQTEDGSTASGGQVAWLFYDDRGAGPDDNHDDLGIRLEITGGSFQVPEPATLGLLGAGLLGLGFAARRRRNV